MNRSAFRKVFREFVILCRQLDLFGRELLAVDGTRIKAVNNAVAELADSGFGGEVKAAMEARAERLIEEGLANRDEEGTAFRRNLLTTLRRKELERIATSKLWRAEANGRRSDAGSRCYLLPATEAANVARSLLKRAASSRKGA